jgi:excisionase family DNA binding protein
MNKREVAERLGVSIRRVEQFDAEDRLGVKMYVKGKTGKQADWSEDAVESLKAELQNPVQPITSLQGANSSVTGHSGLVRRADAGAFLEQLAALMERREAQPQLNIGEKIMLTLADAAALTSLSTNHLRDAIKAGKIKARIIGRGWKIKRADLDAYVRKL